jgi:hypothetical protein
VLQWYEYAEYVFDELHIQLTKYTSCKNTNGTLPTLTPDTRFDLKMRQKTRAFEKLIIHATNVVLLQEMAMELDCFTITLNVNRRISLSNCIKPLIDSAKFFKKEMQHPVIFFAKPCNRRFSCM